MINFVTHLPWSHRRHDAVWVIVDRLTKSAHFLAVQMTFTLEEFCNLCIEEIVWLHGVLVYPQYWIRTPGLRLIFGRVSSEPWGHG